ncbi:MAG TPA: FG-GAP-like repeat-containing protein [Pyrinomonadaceae bacterium]|nr:FG-GAP-like repeat-containing protein [Pyrinomonadaceae bacterium]
MKRTLLSVVFLLLVAGTVQTVIAQKVRLRSQITPNCGSSSNLKYADIYADGNIAVQGSYNCRGVFIYDVTNPDAPTLSSWYNPGANQQFLEAIVIGNRGYFGSGNGGGVHIVDLTNPASPQLLGTVTAVNGNGFNSIHEMVVFDQNGSRYLVENFNGFSSKILKVINVTVPAAPVFVRDINPTEVSWVHAMHIRGNRMFTSGWGTNTTRGRTEIYNIANIGTQAPSLLGFIEDATSVTAGNSMHSSWSSEDGMYLYSCRETSNGSGDVRVYNIFDPSAPLLVNSLTMNGLNLNAVTPHNPVVMGNFLYVSWYQAGVQVFDISSPANPVRVGQYDTFQNAFAPSEEERQTLQTAEPWDMVCASDRLQNMLPTTYDGNWAVYPFLGQNKVLAGDLKNGLLILDATGVTSALKNSISDFDGDGRTDLSTFRSTSGDWLIERSSDNSSVSVNWGQDGDIIAPGDFDGDGKTDQAIFRPSTGYWWFVMSSTGSRPAVKWGLSGDVPVAADYDADGRTDIAVWRPSNGAWYILQSTLGTRIQGWGTNGDKVFAGDFEGDGKADLVVWRPSNGTWYILQSSSTIPMYYGFGTNGDKPVFADYDGDGRGDFSVYRPSTGVWYRVNSTNGAFNAYQFGLAEDMPIPSDFDGDGKSDIAVFRPSTNVWYRINSTDGTVAIRQYGASGDRPSPSSVQPQ